MTSESDCTHCPYTRMPMWHVYIAAINITGLLNQQYWNITTSIFVYNNSCYHYEFLFSMLSSYLFPHSLKEPSRMPQGLNKRSLPPLRAAGRASPASVVWDSTFMTLIHFYSAYHCGCCMIRVFFLMLTPFYVFVIIIILISCMLWRLSHCFGTSQNLAPVKAS